MFQSVAHESVFDLKMTHFKHEVSHLKFYRSHAENRLLETVFTNSNLDNLSDDTLKNYSITYC